MQLSRHKRRELAKAGLARVRARRDSAFTVTEVVTALAIMGLIFVVVIRGYLTSADRAEWSAYSLAAQSLADQGIEQARAAKWEPQTYPVVDELGLTNYVQVERIDLADSVKPVYATNYISITSVSANPPLRQLRTDCVWLLASRGNKTRGPFTNTAICLRASDQ